MKIFRILGKIDKIDTQKSMQLLKNRINGGISQYRSSVSLNRPKMENKAKSQRFRNQDHIQLLKLLLTQHNQNQHGQVSELFSPSPRGPGRDEYHEKSQGALENFGQKLEYDSCKIEMLGYYVATLPKPPGGKNNLINFTVQKLGLPYAIYLLGGLWRHRRVIT